MNEIHDYTTANQALGTKSKLELPGRETFLHDSFAGDIAVAYRGTDIVTYTPDNKIILNAGTWLSVTTMKKMNQYLPDGISVIQTKAKLWKVKVPNGAFADFVNGLVLDLDKKAAFGNVAPDHVERTIELQQAVREYVDEYINYVSRGTLCMEGDIASLSVTHQEAKNGKAEYLTLDQARRIIRSLKYPPSLLQRAVWIEKPDPFYVQMSEDVMNFQREHWVFAADNDAIDSYVKFAKRSLKRLLNKSLGLPINS